MLIDLTNALVGVTASAILPNWAKKEERIRSVIGDLAKDRNTSNWFDEFNRETITSDGLQLVLRIHEVKWPKATFVFMPGTNAYSLLYGQFLLSMASLGYNIVAFDPRGHGSSDGARGSYTMEELLEDYTNIVKFAQEKYDLPIIASGSSQGGIVAFYYALANPDLPALICHNVADLSDESSVALTRLGNLGNSMKPVINFLADIAPELPVPMPVYLNLRRERVKGKRNALQVLLEDPLIPWFVRMKTMKSLGSLAPSNPRSTLKVPALILQAENDTIFRTDYIENILAPCDTADIKIIKGAYHYMIVDEVEQVTDVVKNWLFEKKLIVESV